MGKMLTLLTRFASTLACCLQGGGVFVSSGTVSIINSQVYSNQATYVRAHAQEFPSPHLPQLTLAQLQTKRRSGQHQAVRAIETLKNSYCPHMGDSRVARCLQGGGVYVDSRNSGTVTITSSSIYGNTADDVRAHAQKFPSPQQEKC